MCVSVSEEEKNGFVCLHCPLRKMLYVAIVSNSIYTYTIVLEGEKTIGKLNSITAIMYIFNQVKLKINEKDFQVFTHIKRLVLHKPLE